MTPNPEVADVLDLVAHRIDVLTLLDGDRVRKRAIVDELDYSRSTVNRAITHLADAGLVDDSPGGCRTTFVGSLLADQYRDYTATTSDVVQCRDALAPLPPDADLPPVVLANADVSTPGRPSPYEPYHAVEAVLERPGADGHAQVYVPAFSNPHGLELAQRLATESSVEIVFGDELLAALTADFPDEIETLIETEGFTGYRTAAGPAYSLVVADSASGAEGVVVTHTEERDLGGIILTRDADALEWLERRYSRIRDASERLESSR